MSVTLENGPAALLAGTVMCGSLIIGIGAFLGGYTLGDQPATPAPTALAEKTYTTEDLETALAACRIEGAKVEGSSVTLIGGDWPAYKRQCFIAEMGAPEIAQTEYEYWGGVEVRGGEYAWSNVQMTWEQTDEGRDVTITVE